MLPEAPGTRPEHTPSTGSLALARLPGTATGRCEQQEDSPGLSRGFRQAQAVPSGRPRGVLAGREGDGLGLHAACDTAAQRLSQLGPLP